MNAKKLLGICVLALLVVGWGIMPAVVAADEPPGGGPASDGNDPAPRAQNVGPRHSIPVETLGSSSNAIDAWALLCPSGTHHLHFDVGDFSSSGPTFGIVCLDFNVGAPAAVRRASQGGISSSGQVNGGSGYYTCYVFKTGGSTGSSGQYDSLQVCHNSSHGTINHPTGFPDHYIFIDQ